MVDADIAKLYGVTTKSFNQAVKRNIERFPADFMFQLSIEEYRQLAVSNNEVGQYGGSRYLPNAFTECGVAMLSSVLTSKKAALVNITIMRTFVKMRSFLVMETETQKKVVFERLDNLETEFVPLDPKRKKIGLTGIVNKKT